MPPYYDWKDPRSSSTDSSRRGGRWRQPEESLTCNPPPWRARARESPARKGAKKLDLGWTRPGYAQPVPGQRRYRFINVLIFCWGNPLAPRYFMGLQSPPRRAQEASRGSGDPSDAKCPKPIVTNTGCG